MKDEIHKKKFKMYLIERKKKIKKNYLTLLLKSTQQVNLKTS
jgi:hypothetical protein